MLTNREITFEEFPFSFKNEKREMGGHFSLFIFQFQWKMKLTVCTV